MTCIELEWVNCEMNESIPDSIKEDRSYGKVFDRIILDKQMTDVQKLKSMFGYISQKFVEHGLREIEVLNALGDVETIISERIKLGTMESAREMFEFCYRYLTGDRGKDIWDE